MKAPLSWLAEHVDLPPGATAREVADALIRVGLEVEGVESGAEGLTGPVVVGRVLAFADEPQKNGKVIRWCQVDVGAHNSDGDDGGKAPRGIVCGAHNFAVGDLVVVALPGSVLPGDFAISARRTYGHVSDGMICSVRELGIGDEHDGILVLPPDSAEPGDDPLPLLGLDDAVLDVAVTTDRGYCLSIRGLAREVAAAYGVAFTDVFAPSPEPDGRAYEVHIDDPSGCDLFSVRTVTGLDPAAPSPEHVVRRLRQCGVRSISLAVDVTNYVMLETGQPLHAFDRARLRGPLHARRAEPGERLVTLDDVERVLDPDDMVVADDSGAVALAGVMGGASTEIGPHTGDVVLEAAHWNPAAISRAVRRHHLPSEAARRFERDVDPDIASVALARCVELLVRHGGATAGDGFTVTGSVAPRPRIALAAARPGRTAGMPIERADVIGHLEAVGCTVTADSEAAVLEVTPPSWRPDLQMPADLVEEVVRLVGYEQLPSVLPAARVGTGLTGQQAQLRAVATAVADAGYTEVLSFPFVAPSLRELLGLPGPAVRLANPLSADEPELRTSLLPGLLSTAARNLGRGTRDLAVFETGLVFLPPAADDHAADDQATGHPAPPPVPGVDRRPTDDELAALDASLPAQPRRLAAVLYGDFQPAGWWGAGRRADWADAVELAHIVARAARAELSVRAVQQPPWHPGRCAELLLGDAATGRTVIGHAGELHPRVVAALGLPDRTCAVELDLTALPAAPAAAAPSISGFPPVLLDVALVVPADVPVADVEQTLASAAGPLLESVRLFDVYVDAERIGSGVRSVAFALRLRAADRTLTIEEATAARDAAVAAATQQFGAVLRS